MRILAAIRKHKNNAIYNLVSESEFGTPNVSFCFFLLLHTYVIQVIPGLNEAFPDGEDVAGPAREEGHGRRERQHVIGGADEAQRVFGHLLLQAAQPRLKQDGGDTYRRSNFKFKIT